MKDEGGKFLGLMLGIAVIMALFIAGPFIMIWAVSKLWDVAAVYDSWHWLAGFLFIGLLDRVAAVHGGTK